MEASLSHDSEENPLVKLTALFVLGAGLLALFLGIDWFWMIFALGFAVLVPLVKVVSDGFGTDDDGDETGRAESDRTTPESKQNALDALRDRYARGELSEAEFEQKVETLLETETLEGARERVEREGETEADHETGTDAERATERG
jgi:uncharacterized membrane protein